MGGERVGGCYTACVGATVPIPIEYVILGMFTSGGIGKNGIMNTLENKSATITTHVYSRLLHSVFNIDKFGGSRRGIASAVIAVAVSAVRTNTRMIGVEAVAIVKAAFIERVYVVVRDVGILNVKDIAARPYYSLVTSICAVCRIGLFSPYGHLVVVAALTAGISVILVDNAVFIAYCIIGAYEVAVLTALYGNAAIGAYRGMSDRKLAALCRIGRVADRVRIKSDRIVKVVVVVIGNKADTNHALLGADAVILAHHIAYRRDSRVKICNTDVKKTAVIGHVHEVVEKYLILFFGACINDKGYVDIAGYSGILVSDNVILTVAVLPGEVLKTDSTVVAREVLKLTTSTVIRLSLARPLIAVTVSAVGPGAYIIAPAAILCAYTVLSTGRLLIPICIVVAVMILTGIVIIVFAVRRGEDGMHSAYTLTVIMLVGVPIIRITVLEILKAVVYASILVSAYISCTGELSVIYPLILINVLGYTADASIAVIVSIKRVNGVECSSAKHGVARKLRLVVAYSLNAAIIVVDSGRRDLLES